MAAERRKSHDYKGLENAVEKALDETDKLVREMELESKNENLSKHLKDSKHTYEELQGVLRTYNKRPHSGSSEASEDKLDTLLLNRRKKSTKLPEMSRLTPEEQDLAYELKAQMMRNIDVQNKKLVTELALHEKVEELKLMSKSDKQLRNDNNLTRAQLIKLMRKFEKKAIESRTKVQELQMTLNKTQQLAKKYQDLYENERRNNSKPPRPQTAKEQQSSDEENRPRSSGQRRPVTASPKVDYQRKYEVSIRDGEELKGEIVRLRTDNALLIKKVKHAESDRALILHHLGTSEAAREDLLKRLQKEQKQYKQLNKSLTVQAGDWVKQKQQIQQYEEDLKWSQVNPVGVLAAQKRAQSAHPRKNTDLPRQTLPPEKWANANQT